MKGTMYCKNQDSESVSVPAHYKAVSILLKKCMVYCK